MTERQQKRATLIALAKEYGYRTFIERVIYRLGGFDYLLSIPEDSVRVLLSTVSRDRDQRGKGPRKYVSRRPPGRPRKVVIESKAKKRARVETQDIDRMLELARKVA